MNTKGLRQKILDLAIHGKLVPQNPNDESAEVLLEKIRAEKAEKIKNRELKADKKDSFIFVGSDKRHYEQFTDGSVKDIEDEIPFELPAGWAWCRLGEIYWHTTGKALKKSNEKGTLKKYITTSNLYWDSFDFTEVRSMYFTDDELEKCTIKKGDLVLCNGGDVGRAAIWNFDEDICYQNHVSRLRPRIAGIYNKLYLYLLMFYKERGMLNGKGVGITSLSANDLLSGLFPLPPLAEQKRIVGKIEQIFAQIEELEQNKGELQIAIKQAKAKILDLAIHGKLVPQEESDESAEVLLERIRAEKAEKIKRGEMKADKKDSFIFVGSDKRHYEQFTDGSTKDIEDEIPFELPAGWAWVKLPDLCSIPITDGTHKTPTYSDKENGVPFLSSKDVTSGKIDWSKIKYITKDLHEELYKRLAPRKNDILLAKNGTTGIAALVKDDTVFDIYVTLALIRPITEMIFSQYLLFVINSHFCKNQFNDHLTGIGVPNLHLVDINKTVIPLPPLAEQKRIVGKIEELFEQLDSIAMNLG